MRTSPVRPLRLPRVLQLRLEAMLQEHLQGGNRNGRGGPELDFTRPQGEPALTPADSVSWKVFNNPVSLLIGGITAVLLELAEPRVRSGVWDHTTFRTDPMRRMRRTGLAAMVTVYGARSVAEPMIAGVRRMHERVRGETPDGVAYHANDPELLRWVHATASFGFLEAYHEYVRPVSPEDRDRFYSEGPPVARLYGVEDAPGSEKELKALFAAMLPKLERSEIVFEFLGIMRKVEVMPRPFGVMNRLMIRAAIDLIPAPVREVLGVGRRFGLPPGGASLLRMAGANADRMVLEGSPSAAACVRLGLPKDYLLRR